jgi:hypothetical protein
MGMIYKRLMEGGKYWRQIYKVRILLESRGHTYMIFIKGLTIT